MFMFLKIYLHYTNILNVMWWLFSMVIIIIDKELLYLNDELKVSWISQEFSPFDPDVLEPVSRNDDTPVLLSLFSLLRAPLPKLASDCFPVSQQRNFETVKVNILFCFSSLCQKFRLQLVLISFGFYILWTWVNPFVLVFICENNKSPRRMDNFIKQT